MKFVQIANISINTDSIEYIAAFTSNGKYQCTIGFKSGRVLDTPEMTKESIEKIMRYVTNEKDYTFQ